MGCATNQPNCNPNQVIDPRLLPETGQSCIAAASNIKFTSDEDRVNWIADCDASAQDDTEITSSVEETGSSVKTSALGGDNKNLIMMLLLAGGLYYAYSEGMLKGILK